MAEIEARADLLRSPIGEPVPRGGPAYRSLLFIPAIKPNWLEGLGSQAPDGVILDLEDAVPEADKPLARRHVTACVERYANAELALFVRVNAWGTGKTLQDLECAIHPGIDGILLAKTASPAEVAALDIVLKELEIQRGLPLQSTEIVPLCETPYAIQHHYDICATSARIRRSGSVGIATHGDISSALGVGYSRDGDHAVPFNVRSGLEARAAGIEHVLGGLSPRAHDLTHVRQMATRAKNLGATSSFAIHPAQVPVINEVFSPSPDEIAEAMDIIRTLTHTDGRSKGVTTYKGRMVDEADLRRSRTILARAKEFGLVPDEPTFG